jgi:hypothetical protein
LHGQRIGYIRVSSFDKNPERQLDNVQVDRHFVDKASGKDTAAARAANVRPFHTITSNGNST